jgi:SAM-dependent methyltransferase
MARSPALAIELEVTRCVACGSPNQHPFIVRGSYPVHQCDACGQVFLNPQPDDEVLAAIYSADYFLDLSLGHEPPQVSELKRRTAGLYLEALAEYDDRRSGKLLDVGCGNGEFLLEASRRGFEIEGLDVSRHAVETANLVLGREGAKCSTIERADLLDHHFDVCVCADVVEHTRNPAEFLSHVHRVLKPNGVLLLITPALDCWQSRFMGQNWYEFKTEHLHYFSRSTLENLLARTGFRSIELSGARKVLTLDYIQRHFSRFRVPGWSPLIDAVASVAPSKLRNAPISVPTGSVMVRARAGIKRLRPLVSIIVPVYNERTTVATLLESVIAKELRDADKEIIIVESNSDDGSREEIERFRHAPGVRIVLDDRPRGKGFAVREGLRHAQGDIVLVQDADLEYEVDDYDALLEPLRAYRQAVVLGSRHTGNTKIRNFTHQRLLGYAFNAGHILLTGLFNLCYGQSLKDPWTMYKVFRRDCLHRLKFECNRFDFDVELLAKLVRKGYRPLEIGVAYKSRSFREGKKIRMFRDPWTWFWACVKYRVVSPFGQKAAR